MVATMIQYDIFRLGSVAYRLNLPINLSYISRFEWRSIIIHNRQRIKTHVQDILYKSLISISEKCITSKN